jgi:hypothetical protein
MEFLSVTCAAMIVIAEASHGNLDRHEGVSLFYPLPDMSQDEPR